MVQKKCATCLYYKPGESQSLGSCENSSLWSTGTQMVLAEEHSCEKESAGSQWRDKFDQPTGGHGQPSTDEPPKPSVGELIARVSERIKQFVAGIVATEPQKIPTIVVALFCGLIVFICILAFFDLFLGIPILPEITVVVMLLLSGLGAVIWLIRHPEKLRGDKSTRTQKRL